MVKRQHSLKCLFRNLWYNSSDKILWKHLHHTFPTFERGKENHFTSSLGEVKIKKLSKQLTFIVKAIYPVDGCTLMVSSQKEKILRVFDFVSK